MYVYCGLDALLQGATEDISIESGCPHCSQLTSLSVKRAEIISVKPSSAVFWYGVSEKATSDPLAYLCPCSYLNCFPSKEHLDGWLVNGAKSIGFAMSARDAYKYAKSLVARIKEFAPEVKQ